MEKIKKMVSGVVLTAMLIAPVITAVAIPEEARAEGEVLISVVPSVETVAPGDPFTVDIVIDPNGNEIAGIQTNFEYDDPSLVQANSVTFSSVVDYPSLWSDNCDGFGTWCYPGIDNDAGIIGSWIMASPKDGVFPSAAFTLLTINLTARADVSGTSHLRLPDPDHGTSTNDLIILDSSYSPLPYSVTNSSITIAAPDETSPTITGVTSTTSNSAYKAGDTVDIDVVFDEPVNVSGTPQLELETGDIDYTDGSGTETLIFTYTVQEGDNSPDLDYTSNGALTLKELKDETIKDAAGNDADLTLPNPGEAGSLGANKDIVIDTTLPTIKNYTLNGEEKSVAFNPDLAEVKIEINASEEVDWTSIKIENVDDSGIYKIWQPGADCDGSSQCVKIWDGSLSGGTLVDGEYKIKVNIKDAAGNVFDNGNDNYLIPHIITVDTIAPTVELLNIPSSPINQTAIDITVGGEDVTHYKYKLDEGEYGEETSVEISIQLSDLLEDEHTIYVIGRDAAGNWQEEATTYIWTIDTTPPVITLLGDNPVNLYVGNTYDDAGATALDDVDGDITSDIITVNPVDTATAGTYTITYNVSDTAGNSAKEVIRTVNISEVPAPAGGGGIVYNYSAAIDQHSLEKTVGVLTKEKIIVKNTGSGRLNPGTLTMTLSPEYLALNLADPVWKSYNSDTGIAVWETPALDYAKEYLLEIELLPFKAGEDIITSLVYHTINTEVSASAAETIKPAVEEETPLDTVPKEESQETDAPASETIGEGETAGTTGAAGESSGAESSPESEERADTSSSIEAASTSSFTETEEGRVAGESSDDAEEENPPSPLLQRENEAEEKINEENLPGPPVSGTGEDLLQRGNELEEDGKVKGEKTGEEILTEEEDKEGEDKNIKEIVQGFISGYWWLGALVIILGSLGYYYLGGKRKSKES